MFPDANHPPFFAFMDTAGADVRLGKNVTLNILIVFLSLQLSDQISIRGI